MSEKIVKYRGITVTDIARSEYKKRWKDWLDSDLIYHIVEDDSVIYRGKVYGKFYPMTKEERFYKEPYEVVEYFSEINHDQCKFRMTTMNGDQLNRAISRRAMEKEEADKWLENEIMKLTPGSYVRTYYTVAQLRRMGSLTNEPATCDIVHVIVPVEVYENGEYGFEIIAIATISGLCPWDMTKTIAHIKTEYTTFDGVLHDIVLESIPIYNRVRSLVRDKECEFACKDAQVDIELLHRLGEK